MHKLKGGEMFSLQTIKFVHSTDAKFYNIFILGKVAPFNTNSGTLVAINFGKKGQLGNFSVKHFYKNSKTKDSTDSFISDCIRTRDKHGYIGSDPSIDNFGTLEEMLSCFNNAHQRKFSNYELSLLDKKYHSKPKGSFYDPLSHDKEELLAKQRLQYELEQKAIREEIAKAEITQLETNVTFGVFG